MSEPTVLDSNVLDELLAAVGYDRQFLKDLVHTYLEDAPRQMAAMQRALEAGDRETLRRAAHSLKSNSAGFGASTLAQLCRELEDLARGGLNGAAGRVAQILVEYQKVQAALEAFTEDHEEDLA